MSRLRTEMILALLAVLIVFTATHGVAPVLRSFVSAFVRHVVTH